jgi:hypothetical protein
MDKLKVAVVGGGIGRAHLDAYLKLPSDFEVAAVCDIEPVTLADARLSLELVTAMYDSAQTSKAVELPIGEDHPKYGSWLPQDVPSGG